MFVKESWQRKLPTLVARTTSIFNDELLSDVKFVVPESLGESKSKKVIPAHKFVLAISSPVFFAMLHGQMARETKDSIELPDCEYESLLELFRFLYSDKVNLSGNNVMQVLYLANKYMVPSLAEKCSEYLCDNLTACNVFCILTHAQKFCNQSLEDRCWEVIERHTNEALTSDEFVTVERSVVESVVKKEVLNVKEVELFKAVDRWATKECEKKSPMALSNGEQKRQILGDEIVKAIRFPLMSEKIFMSVVLDSQILTLSEVEHMIKHYSGDLQLPLPFMESARGKTDHFRCNRFQKFNAPCTGGGGGYYSVTATTAGGSWSYNGATADSINFTVNKPITLHGIQHFGSKGGDYIVSTNIKDTTRDSCLGKESGTYTAEKEVKNNYYGFDVLFDRPISLEANKQYTLVSAIEGPLSWYGAEGQMSAESGGVQFSFSDSDDDSNGTLVTIGQFPVFIFS
ncbi:BTB/POZ domain-containing protein 6-like [Stylophora pistillata]|uniref:BTB/POZ domain-containing protein 6-like n=1 Tax=Stylophora pistillata TaxID=50429 RepID=UPI000C045B1B|nr:BTB/POZ domain-containing protein 6-like [Stylophora pistillata]